MQGLPEGTLKTKLTCNMHSNAACDPPDSRFERIDRFRSILSNQYSSLWIGIHSGRTDSRVSASAREPSRRRGAAPQRRAADSRANGT
ncbi:hypothetical protein EVAR_32941_1 [Eumeta japonica]|uniref:Uncharacterized protein n=1 Tax=Eumeta variegata TaxID=151549 RepID=A0A4C1X4F4_EUMVA|nr:hypothetical protein EVAR_32941_1 [Eumeta japonica]